MTTILSFPTAARRATRVALALIAGAALLCSCTQDDAPDAPDSGDRIPVTFSAGIESAAVTRTTGLDNNTWTSTDHIGIVMAKAGDDIGYGEGAGAALASNIEYAADKIGTNDKGRSTATFIPVDDPIYYPRTGQVDFYAYYPYTKRDNKGGKLDDTYGYTVDLSEQSNPAAIDLLYAEALGIERSRKPVEFDFNHMCTKITLNVAAGEGFTADDIKALPAADVNVKIQTAVIMQVSTFGRVFVKKGSPTKDVHPYKHNVVPAGANATFSIIFSPRNDKDIPVSITIGGKVYTVNLTPKEIYNSDPGNYIPWQPGANYVYPVTIKRTGIEINSYSIEDWEVEDNKGTGTMEKPDVVYIHAGTFLMGSPENEKDRDQGEVQHQVTLTKGFYMAKYQTTNAQYAAFLNAIGVDSDGKCPAAGIYPAAQHPGQLLVTDCTKEYGGSTYPWGVEWKNNQWEPMSGYSDYPAIYVTWYGADEYAHWQGGSLPTEAQWEYACRAGSTTAFTGGDDATDGLGDYGWYQDNSERKTHPVGTKKANAWGLYDMHGNVYEWCLDGWIKSYSPDPVEDPLIPITGIDSRMRRGGMYGNTAGHCRSAYRNPDTANSSDYYNGFRIVFNE
jgi:sulfatase modifying factor 1